MFGFSFTAARIPMLLVALVTVFLMQRTLVRLGISERSAVLGTLTFALSPLFMMLSATMMTDVPGFFAILGCIYGCIRALQALEDREAVLWLCAAVTVNCVCGTSRQIAWLGVLVIVPSTLWLLRSRRKVLLRGAAVTAAGWLFLWEAMRWYARQPYALPGNGVPHKGGWINLTNIVAFDRSLLTMTLLLMPVLAPYLLEIRFWRRRSFAVAALLLAAVSVFFYALLHAHGPAFVDLKFMLDPFVGDWVGIHGTFDGLTLNDQHPPALIGHGLHRFLGLLTAASLLSVVVTIVSSPSRTSDTSTRSISRAQLTWLLGPFLLIYLFLLLNRPIALMFDRYLLAPIFVFLIVVLRYARRCTHWSVGATSVGLVCVLAWWGVVSTHNVFALTRARIAMYNELVGAGLSVNAVDFGWEQNDWVTLQQQPNINSDQIVTPPHTYIPIQDPKRSGCYAQLFFGSNPRLAPQYGLAFDPNSCEGPAPFAPVSYISWPGSRPVSIYVVKYPPPWVPETTYAVPSASSPLR